MSQQPTPHPQERLAREVVDCLRTAGHIAYYAGGCVRDRLLGRTPKDFDVATDATPDRIREIFGRRRTLAIGAAFGVISVLGRKDLGEDPIEVAAFRSDGNYADGRRPDSVVFTTPEEDAQRRDFTINGLFFDPIQEQVIDYVGGQQDLATRQIRAIGNPDDRIAEDKLRLLRAVRFAATFDFDMEEETFAALVKHADSIRVVSGERIGAEMRRLLASPHAHRGLELLVASKLSDTMFSSLSDAWPTRCDKAESLGIELNLNGDDLLRSLLQSRPSLSFTSGLACCLFAADCSADDVDSILREISKAWRLSNEEAACVKDSLALLPQLVRADQLAWSTLQPLLVSRHAQDAVEFAQTVTTALGLPMTGIDLCEQRLAWALDRLNPPHLLSGDDLIRHGLSAGPLFKTIIEDVRRKQLDGELIDANAATEYVQERYVSSR